MITPISWLERGCQYCRANATRKAARDADVPRLCPEIAAQWHPRRNGGWTPTQASPESRRMAWWLDPNCGHQWQQTPRERDKYTRRRCPECDTVLDSLAYHYPELAADTLAGRPSQRKRLCRTFSDCTTAPRAGLISGCFPLDPFYKDRPERVELAAVKRRTRLPR